MLGAYVTNGQRDFFTDQEKSLTTDFVPALRFRALTRFYDTTVRFTTRERRVKQYLLDAAAITPGALVLDLGCGTGTLSIWIKQQCPDARVVGLDADREILEIARRKAKRAAVDIEFLEANAADIPMQDCSVDCLVSSLFFHHLPPEMKRKVLAEVLRVLRNDAAIHISDWGRPSNVLMRALFFLVQWLDGFATTGDSVSGRLPAMLVEAGARDVDEYGCFNTMLGTIRLLVAKR